MAESLAEESDQPGLSKPYQDVLLRLAKRYYAGGRTMRTSVLRDTFQNLLEPAKQLQTQYLPQIRQQVETIDMGRVMAMICGG